MCNIHNCNIVESYQPSLWSQIGTLIILILSHCHLFMPAKRIRFFQAPGAKITFGFQQILDLIHSSHLVYLCISLLFAGFFYPFWGYLRISDTSGWPCGTSVVNLRKFGPSYSHPSHGWESCRPCAWENSHPNCGPPGHSEAAVSNHDFPRWARIYGSFLIELQHFIVQMLEIRSFFGGFHY